MADFKYCFAIVDGLEGDHKVHTVKGDRGGMTYRGIARNKWPEWFGWQKIDTGEYDEELDELVELFYRRNFWDKIQGDLISSNQIALVLYSSFVNIGNSAIKIMQTSLGFGGRDVDGIIGPKTIKAINDHCFFDTDRKCLFLDYMLGLVFHYKDVCLKDPRRKNDKVESNLKFLCGWINRVQRIK